MHIEFITGFLIGVTLGIFLGLAFTAMCFGVIAKVVIMAATYRHDVQWPWRNGIAKSQPDDGQKPT